jgi:hypothetical protein
MDAQKRTDEKVREKSNPFHIPSLNHNGLDGWMKEKPMVKVKTYISSYNTGLAYLLFFSFTQTFTL